jgi:hypothetical protein
LITTSPPAYPDLLDTISKTVDDCANEAGSRSTILPMLPNGLCFLDGFSRCVAAIGEDKVPALDPRSQTSISLTVLDDKMFFSRYLAGTRQSNRSSSSILPGRSRSKNSTLCNFSATTLILISIMFLGHRSVRVPLERTPILVEK